MHVPVGSAESPGQPPEGRLDSWKEIALYLRRDVTTVRRWEKREGLPVHRHVHDKLGSVYAFKAEIDTWSKQRADRDSEALPSSPSESARAGVAPQGERQDETTLRPLPGASTTGRRPARVRLAVAGVAGVVIVSAAAWWLAARGDALARNPLHGATFTVVTDFGGTERAATVSRDGRFVAFVSDRDGQSDVWVTQVGTGQFYNLTRGRVRELANPAVRALGFSPDGTLVTFWARGVEGASSEGIGVWAVPTLGGQARPYLEVAAEYDWSPDGSRLVYHTAGPGDPTFVTDASAAPGHEPVFTAATGHHAHFSTWSPDNQFIYFVQGVVPDGMDLYRMRPDGSAVERMTHHDAGVSHPVFVGRRVVAYLVGDRAGSGSRLYAIDVDRRVPRPLGRETDRYHSLATAAAGRRWVASVVNAKSTLWKVAFASGAPATSATPMLLPTGRLFSPRLGPGYLLYASPKDQGHGIWKVVDGVAAEIWMAADARVLGGLQISPDGRRIAFSSERQGHPCLEIVNVDGTGARVVSDALVIRGSPAWAPDGRSLTTGAIVDGRPQLVQVALDGTVRPFVAQSAVDPTWSPDGELVVYSGADVGTQFRLAAATSSGASHPLPDVALTRGARRTRFAGPGRLLVVMRGDIRHKNLWGIDLDTGAERQLTDFPPDFVIRDFDVSPDGREIVVERLQEPSDIVLIDLAPT